MDPEKERSPLFDFADQCFTLVPREEVLTEIERRLSRDSRELIYRQELDMSDPAELGAIFHIAIRATHGDVRSEREVVRRIVDMGVAAYRDRILAYLITTQFIRDLAKMERAKEALWRIKRIEAKLQGKPLPPDLE